MCVYFYICVRPMTSLYFESYLLTDRKVGETEGKKETKGEKASYQV